jgi:hypothetical protein
MRTCTHRRKQGRNRDDTPPLTSLAYGEKIVSWQTVWDDLYPNEAGDPHGDATAAAMHRLRGLIMAQGAEIEAAIGALVKRLSPDARIDGRTAGWLLKEVKRLLSAHHVHTYSNELRIIGTAINRRNHAVHSPVIIGFSWRDYSTGGGEWVPVISLMNDATYDEADLLHDLALQQQGTTAAVHLLHACSEVCLVLRGSEPGANPPSSGSSRCRIASVTVTSAVSAIAI